MSYDVTIRHQFVPMSFTPCKSSLKRRAENLFYDVNTSYINWYHTGTSLYYWMGGWRRCPAVRAVPLRACACMGVDACRAALGRGPIRVGWQPWPQGYRPRCASWGTRQGIWAGNIARALLRLRSSILLFSSLHFRFRTLLHQTGMHSGGSSHCMRAPII